MKLQVQENGSYRASDCAAALEWILPDAADSSESLVVLLDWFSAHRSEEVEQVVHRKGHVLLFHGGGVTPFIQVNDTHLHASVARSLIALEKAWAHSERMRAGWAGEPQTTPPATRPTAYPCANGHCENSYNDVRCSYRRQPQLWQPRPQPRRTPPRHPPRR